MSVTLLLSQIVFSNEQNVASMVQVKRFGHYHLHM